jgi:hypothetical protein
MSRQSKIARMGGGSAVRVGHGLQRRRSRSVPTRERNFGRAGSYRTHERKTTLGRIVITDHVLALAKFESDVGASGEHIERSLSALRNADPVEGTHQGLAIVCAQNRESIGNEFHKRRLVLQCCIAASLCVKPNMVSNRLIVLISS